MNALARAANGMLWIATDEGVAGFDGAELSWVDVPPSFGNAVSVVVPAAPRGVWVGSAVTPEVVLLEGGAPLALGSERGLAGSRITALAQGTHRLWIGTDAGLFVWQEGQGRAAAVPLAAAVHAIAIDAAGAWIGSDKGLLRAHLVADEPVKLEFVWPTAAVVAVAVGGGDVFFWTADEELFRRPATPDARPDAPPVPYGHSRFGAWQASGPGQPAGQLWLAGDTGVSRLDLATDQRHYDVAAVGATITAIAVHGDRELWLATTDGRVFLLDRAAPFRLLPTLVPEAVFGVAAAPAGVWLVGATGRLFEVQGSNVNAHVQPTNASFAVLRTVVQTATGQVVVGSLNAGLLTLGAGGIKPWDRRQSEGALILDANATSLWVARGTRVQQLALQPFGLVKASFDVTGVTHGLEAPGGTMWLGGDGAGLSSIANQGNAPLRRFGANEGLTTSRVSAIVAGADDTLWVATLDQGLFRASGERFTHVSLRPEVPTLRVETALLDRRGYLWLATRTGLFRLPEASLRRRAAGGRGALEVLALDARDGLPSSAFIGRALHTAFEDAQGNLWFCSEGGPVIVPASLSDGQAAPPAPRLASVQFDGRLVPTGNQPLRLPRGQGQVEIRVSTPFFRARHRLSHRWRLRGLDDAWRSAPERQAITLANLPPREYVFEVMAALQTPKGAELSRPTRLTFELVPSFFERLPVQLLLALFGVTLLLFVTRLRRRRQEERRLALAEQRNAIAREIHDGLAQLLTGARMQVELAIADQQAEVGPLQKALDGINRGLEETRAALWSLRTGAFEGVELPSCLARAAREVLPARGVTFDLVVPGHLESLRDAPSTFKWHLSAIVREAVANAIRHGRAGRVQVAVERKSRAFCLSITDDGQGTDCEKQADWVAEGHYGVMGMKERAARLRGTFELRSKPGEGTCVTVTVPWPLENGSEGVSLEDA